MRDLVVGQLAEAGADDHQIRRVQRGGAGDVFLEIRVDVAAVRIDREEHDAVESVFLAEDLRQHRAGFLAAVFLVAGNEDNFFAVGRARLGGQVQPVGGTRGQGETDEEGKEGLGRVMGM